MPGRVVHRFEHVRDEFAQFIVNRRHRGRFGPQTRIWKFENLQFCHSLNISQLARFWVILDPVKHNESSDISRELPKKRPKCLTLLNKMSDNAALNRPVRTLFGAGNVT